MNLSVLQKLSRLTLVIISLLVTSAHAQNELIWRKLDPQDTVYMQIGEGLVVFELNPLFAPKTVKQFKQLLKDDFYRSLSFYRVIDGFVAQGGDESDINVPMCSYNFHFHYGLYAVGIWAGK